MALSVALTLPLRPAMGQQARLLLAGSSLSQNQALRSFASTSQVRLQTPASPPPPSPSVPAATRLSWNEYLRLRKSRRRAGMLTSIPTTAGAGLLSGSYFLTQELDPSNAIFGIDPAYVYVIGTLAITGLGYLVGPSLGSWVWSRAHKSTAQEMQLKDADFYEHIQRRQVDPTRANMQNPIPDFYGEKIGSLHEYRKWLRDCAIYTRKAAHGLKQETEAAEARGL